jgi:hypothetical protein
MSSFRSPLYGLLAKLYGDAEASQYVNEFLALIENGTSCTTGPQGPVLVAYPDHVRTGQEAPLQTLRNLVSRLEVFGALHLLPPFRSLTDEGFAPSSHHDVTAAYGSSADLDDVTRAVPTTLDLVLNHVSTHHDWFISFLNDEQWAAGFFIQVTPNSDFSRVVPGKLHPPISAYRRPDGRVITLWTKYSTSQVDLNYRNPAVLLAMCRVLTSLLEKGASGIRLDALPFLWKSVDRPSAHEPEVFLILAVLRLITDAASHGTGLLVAEADYTTGESSYLGLQGAHIGYRYASAPCILGTVISGQTEPYLRLVRELEAQHPESLAYNFLSTHDSIFMRPYASPVAEHIVHLLRERTEAAGGVVQYRAHGSSPQIYELNVALVDLLTFPDRRNDQEAYKAIFTGLFLVFILPGLPLVYLGHLLAIRNESAPSHEPRGIGRGRVAADDFEELVSESVRELLVLPLVDLTSTWRNLDCFRPESRISVGPELPDGVVSVVRRGSRSEAWCVANLGASDATVMVPDEFCLVFGRLSGSILRRFEQAILVRNRSEDQ